jgi:hypothetical protein
MNTTLVAATAAGTTHTNGLTLLVYIVVGIIAVFVYRKYRRRHSRKEGGSVAVSTVRDHHSPVVGPIRYAMLEEIVELSIPLGRPLTPEELDEMMNFRAVLGRPLTPKEFETGLAYFARESNTREARAT